MKTINDYKHVHYIMCDCTDFDHTIRIMWDEDIGAVEDTRDIDPYIYIDTMIAVDLPWYKRLHSALMYALGKKEISYCETLTTLNGVKKLTEFLNNFVEYKESKYKEVEENAHMR